MSVDSPARLWTTWGERVDGDFFPACTRESRLRRHLGTLMVSARCETVGSEGRTAPTDTALVAHNPPVRTNGADTSMPVTKRTRYEVLRRDNHTCRYCGGVAPDVKLTVDHVTPVALGGTDDPSNLVAACRDCNYGKASTSPDEVLVQQVGEDDMRWADAIKRAAEAMAAEPGRAKTRHAWFLEEWQKWDSDYTSIPDGWAKSLDHWLGAGLPKEVLLDCLDIAVCKRGVAHYAVFAYMGGIARKRIEKLHTDAKALLDSEERDAS